MARYRSPIADRLRLNLDLNENAAGCSPAVVAKLQSLAVEDLARYPQRELGEQIVADFLEVSPNNVLLTNGIDEALQVI
jgi:histidinol-phosphate/aromatic aminotransferase/cobyric acid decarboxylase-like protein